MLPVIESTHGDFPRLIGVTDGINARFQTRLGWAAHTRALWWLNGALQSPGVGEDYEEKWALVGTIDFNNVPPEDDKVTVMYWPIGDNS